jgi:anthranilate phosphoribosyltransferase
LANPAGADFHLLGVGRSAWLDGMAGALARLGARHAFLVCARDGLDEVSLAGPTAVREVCGDVVTALEWTPDDFGLEPCRLEELRAAGPDESAATIRDVLQGRDGPAARIVLANAAAALLAAELVPTLLEGVAMARRSIASGAAERVLAGLVAASAVS